MIESLIRFILSNYGFLKFIIEEKAIKKMVNIDVIVLMINLLSWYGCFIYFCLLFVFGNIINVLILMISMVYWLFYILYLIIV